MDLPSELMVIHQPVRLKVMTLLYRHGDVGFTEAHKNLGLTPGNLDAHSKKLAEEGLLESRRVLMKDHFEVRLRITQEGTRRFDAYLRALQGFLAAATGG